MTDELKPGSIYKTFGGDYVLLITNTKKVIIPVWLSTNSGNGPYVRTSGVTNDLIFVCTVDWLKLESFIKDTTT